MRILLALLTLTLLPLAPASGIPATLTVTPFEGPIPMEGRAEAAKVPVTFEYACGGMTDAFTEAGMRLLLSVAHAPGWVQASIEPRESLLPECEGTGRVDATLTAIARPDAPGPRNATLRVVGQWLASGFALDVVGDTEVETAWSGEFDARAEITEAVGKPQSALVFPIVVKNTGNGATKYFFEVVSAADGFQTPIPPPIVLQAGSGQTTTMVPLTIVLPYRNGPNDHEGDVTIRITPVSVDDPTLRGESQELTLRAASRGFYVPGPQLFGALAALALAAIVLRRRR